MPGLFDIPTPEEIRARIGKTGDERNMSLRSTYGPAGGAGAAAGSLFGKLAGAGLRAAGVPGFGPGNAEKRAELAKYVQNDVANKVSTEGWDVAKDFEKVASYTAQAFAEAGLMDLSIRAVQTLGEWKAQQAEIAKNVADSKKENKANLSTLGKYQAERGAALDRLASDPNDVEAQVIFEESTQQIDLEQSKIQSIINKNNREDTEKVSASLREFREANTIIERNNPSDLYNAMFLLKDKSQFDLGGSEQAQAKTAKNMASDFLDAAALYEKIAAEIAEVRKGAAPSPGLVQNVKQLGRGVAEQLKEMGNETATSLGLSVEDSLNSTPLEGDLETQLRLAQEWLTMSFQRHKAVGQNRGGISAFTKNTKEQSNSFFGFDRVFGTGKTVKNALAISKKDAYKTIKRAEQDLNIKAINYINGYLRRKGMEPNWEYASATKGEPGVKTPETLDESLEKASGNTPDQQTDNSTGVKLPPGAEQKYWETPDGRRVYAIKEGNQVVYKWEDGTYFGDGTKAPGEQ